MSRIKHRFKLKLPKLPRKIDPRKAKGYRGYRGGRGPTPFWAWLAAGAGFLVLMALEWNLCRAFPAVSTFCRGVATFFARIVGFFCGILPFPVSEWLLVGLVLGWLGYFIVKALRRDWSAVGRGLCKLVSMGCAAAFLFVFLYGVHHTAPSLADQMGLTVEKYSVEQLAGLMARTVEQSNELAARVPRDETGVCDFGSFRAMARQISDAYTVLSDEYAVFDRPQSGRVKRSLIGGRVMSYVDLAGYYCPWTAESVVSSDVVDTHIPFNIAHETAHGMGIGPENACNFAAWLVCKDHSDPKIAYSGWLCAFVYTNNALYAADYDLWLEQYAGLSEQVRFDLKVLSDSLARYENTKANEIGSRANDALIKATGQAEGLRSYGRVVDLMLAYYSAENE